jgi:integrase
MRVENIDFDGGTITVPNSKTESGKRHIPMGNRVAGILRERCRGRGEGWVWQSRYKASTSGRPW